MKANTNTYYSWLVWLVISSFLFYKYVLQVYPSIMTNQLMAQFHLSGLGLGNLAACFYYSYLVMQFFVGFILDKYNTRLLTTLAIALCAAGVYLFAHADNFGMAAFARSLIGVGVAFTTVCYMKITSLWFSPKQFAFVCGLLATAAMLGALFGSAPLAWYVASVGWRYALTLVAYSGFGLAIIFFLIARDKKNEAATTLENQTLRLNDFITVFKNKQNWLLTFYSGLAFSPLAVFGGLWGNPFLVEAYQLTATQSGALVSASFLGLAVGGPLSGLLSQWHGKRKPTMLVGTSLGLVTIALVIYSHHLSYWLLVSLLFIFGVGIGSFMLGFTVGRETNVLSLTATVIALINTGDAFFNAITEPLLGHLLDLSWDGKILNGARYFSLNAYHEALAILPLYLLVAVGLLFFLKETHCQQTIPESA